MTTWVDLEDAADALDGLLGELGASPTAKAKTDPLERSGYDTLVRLMLRDLLRVTRGPEKRALQRMVSALDVNWTTMTERARERAIAAASRRFIGAELKDLVPTIGNVVKDRSAGVVRETKRAVAERFELKIPTTFDSTDNRVLDHARSSQALFIRDEWGRRAEGYSQRARNVVADGIRDGFDSATIGSNIAKDLAAAAIRRSQSYYEVVSTIFVARARSYGELRGFSDAGIERFIFTAMLDQRTTEMCRFMHGRVFSTQSAMARYAEVAAAPPEAVVDLQPFARIGKDDAGDQWLFFKRGEERVRIARVDEPAVGRLDEVGKYSRAMSTADLERSGLSTPPLHGRCRSLLLPG